MALTTRMCEVLDEQDDGGSGVGSADADVVESAVVAQGDGAGFVDAVVADPVVGVGVAGLAGQGFGQRVVAACGGGSVRQGAVRAAVVVLVDEGVEQGLQLGDRGGLVGLGAEPVLHGLLESLDLAAGGGVAGSGVLLDDVQASELVLEGVASAAAAGEPDGVDHAVVGQGGGRDPMWAAACAEGGGDDRAGDPAVGGDVQGVAGAVVEPGDDLDVGAVGS